MFFNCLIYIYIYIQKCVSCFKNILRILIYLFSTYHIWIPLPLTDEEILQRANTVLPLVNHPFDLALFSACATANLYTNAIILNNYSYIGYSLYTSE